jgi:hypothetical protein
MCTSCFDHRHKAVIPPPSPSLNQKAIVLKQLSGERFGKIIGALISRFNFEKVEFIGMRPEPVPFVQEVSSSVGDAVVGGQEEGALVVFKDLGANGGADG